MILWSQRHKTNSWWFAWFPVVVLPRDDEAPYRKRLVWLTPVYREWMEPFPKLVPGFWKYFDSKR